MHSPQAAITLPSLNIGTLLEAHRKNAAALASANQAALDGLKTLAQRQRDLLEITVDDYSKVTSDVLGATSFEERAMKQADATRHIYVSAVARFHELYDIAVKANVTAVDILNARVAEAFDELRALFAAPATPTPATSTAPTSITGPAAVVEDVSPASDAVDPVEAEATVTAAPTTAPKRPARSKTTRRPTSRS